MYSIIIILTAGKVIVRSQPHFEMTGERSRINQECKAQVAQGHNDRYIGPPRISHGQEYIRLYISTVNEIPADEHTSEQHSQYCRREKKKIPLLFRRGHECTMLEHKRNTHCRRKSVGRASI